MPDDLKLLLLGNGGKDLDTIPNRQRVSSTCLACLAKGTINPHRIHHLIRQTFAAFTLAIAVMSEHRRHLDRTQKIIGGSRRGRTGRVAQTVRRWQGDFIYRN